MSEIDNVIKVLTVDNFKNYGYVLQTGAIFKTINQGTSQKWNNIIPKDTFVSANGQNIGILRTDKFTPIITKLERHRFTSQLFYPITKGKSLVIVAEGNDMEIDKAKIEVFLMNEGQGICFHPLTWHYQLIPIGGPSDYLTIMLNSEKPDIEYSNEFSPLVLETDIYINNEVQDGKN